MILKLDFDEFLWIKRKDKHHNEQQEIYQLRTDQMLKVLHEINIHLM